MPTNAELAKEVEVLRKELGEMHESLKLFNGLYEEVKKSQELLQKENKELTKKNEQLTLRMSELEQHSRQNNIEIKGVPVTQAEDCLAILQQIGEKVECPISAADVDVVHRVPAKNNEQHIIARFCSRTKKAEFAGKAKKARLTAGTIGFQSHSQQPVYVNDHLTPENKRLFAQALAKKNEMNWQFLWVENCRIKARKAQGDRVHRISKVSDLAIFS